MAETIDTEGMMVCHACSTSFLKRKGQNKYCSPGCRRSVETKAKARRRVENGSKRKGEIFTCSKCGCGTIFKGGRNIYCDPCRKTARKETFESYAIRNPEKRKILDEAWKVRRKSDPNYQKWAREYFTAYSRERRKDPRIKLDHRISQLVRNGLNGAKDGKAWEKLVGYSLDELMKHIERQFYDGMGWHNIGDWHVDHIIPRSSFEYQSPSDEDFKACWAMTNLRPLWSTENISKGAKRLHLL